MNGTGVDLNLFKFDYYGTWAAFFLNQHGHIYARYGLRKNKENQDEAYMSANGLQFVMKESLEAHKKDADRKPDPPLPATPLLSESLTKVPADMKTGKACMHCHHAWVYGDQERPRAFSWRSPEIPLPEAIGLTLNVDEGNIVTAVKSESAAARAGILPKDRIVSMNQTAIYSGADVAWVVNLLPKGQSIRVQILRGNSKSEVTLTPGK